MFVGDPIHEPLDLRPRRLGERPSSKGRGEQAIELVAFILDRADPLGLPLRAMPASLGVFEIAFGEMADGLEASGLRAVLGRALILGRIAAGTSFGENP